MTSTSSYSHTWPKAQSLVPRNNITYICTYISFSAKSDPTRHVARPGVALPGPGHPVPGLADAWPLLHAGEGHALVRAAPCGFFQRQPDVERTSQMPMLSVLGGGDA
jgi:hypothetical protein